MEPDDRREFRDYAWRYFELHADHRLRAFNFFIIFASIIVGAFGTLTAKTGLQPVYAWLPAAMSFFAFIFWKFEERTRMLVKNGENALKYLDKIALEDSDSPLRLFDNDDIQTEGMHRWPVSTGYFSYSRAFRAVYLLFGLLGLVGTIFCLAAT